MLVVRPSGNVALAYAFSERCLASACRPDLESLRLTVLVLPAGIENEPLEYVISDRALEARPPAARRTARFWIRRMPAQVLVPMHRSGSFGALRLISAVFGSLSWGATRVGVGVGVGAGVGVGFGVGVGGGVGLAW